MPKINRSLQTKPARQKAFLVGVDIKSTQHRAAGQHLTLEASLQELALLCDTAGLEVVGQMTQALDAPNVATYIGSGKVQELLTWKETLGFEVVVFDDELSPRHQRELEEQLGVAINVVDRTGLILDIFAQHARTAEGALQVELAQYEYRLPRLTRQWTHLARQAGGGSGRSGNGGVGLRGPGEKQLEIDRRRIREVISGLKEDLEKVRAQRATHRKARKRSETPVVAIVGYTNAGKSTLLNAIAKSDVLAEDRLFATLDPTTRKVRLPRGNTALFTDTVGFIQKLPTQLVAAFRATLEEITEADALLHVVDATHPNALEQAETVMETLKELGAGDKQMIIALNKADRLPGGADDPAAAVAALHLPGVLSDGIASSALKRGNLEALLGEIEAVLFERMIPIRVTLPYKAGDVMSLFRRSGVIDLEVAGEKTLTLTGRIPGRLLDVFAPYRATE